jgi:hypothetical protein
LVGVCVGDTLIVGVIPVVYVVALPPQPGQSDREVGVLVGVGVGVLVGVCVGVSEGGGDCNGVLVGVGLTVSVGVCVFVGVLVGV